TRQVELIRVEYVMQKIAAAVEARARLARLNQPCILFQKRGDRRNNVIEPIVRRVHGGPARLPGHVHGRPVVEYGAETNDVIAREAVTERARAGGIRGEHAAERAFAVGWVRRETPANARQFLGEIAIDYARLNADGIGAHIQNGAEMFAQIDNQPRAERFASDARARAARHQGHLMLAGVAYQRLHVLFVARHDDAGRPHLEDGGVRAVERARQIIEQQFAFEDALQVIADA